MADARAERVFQTLYDLGWIHGDFEAVKEALFSALEREYAAGDVPKQEPLPMQFFMDSINRQNLLLTEIVTELKQRPSRDRFVAACAAMQGLIIKWHVDKNFEPSDIEGTAKMSCQFANALLERRAKEDK